MSQEGSSPPGDSVLGSSGESSYSILSTPFGSELSSTETSGSEDEDFMAELTRQMAECMLREYDDDESTVSNCFSENSVASDEMNHVSQSNKDSASIPNFRYRLYSNQGYADQRMPPIQVYQLKNQPPVRKQGRVGNARRVPVTGSTQPTELNYEHYRGQKWGKGHYGSDMQAVFLGGPVSKNGCSGTGVFLPRATNEKSKLKKKSGCSTVLIPTRVLQTLELHFNKHRASDSSPPGGDIGGCRVKYIQQNDVIASNDSSSQLNKHRHAEEPEKEEEEMQLPQEWTY